MTTVLRLVASVWLFFCSLGLSPVPSSAQTPVADIPDNPAGRQAAWLLESFNDPDLEFTNALIEEHFSSTFLGEDGAGYLTYTFQLMLKPNGPFAITAIDEGSSDTEITLHAISKYQSDFELILIVEPASPNLIADFQFGAAPRNSPLTGLIQDQVQIDIKNVANWEEFNELWTTYGEHASFLAAEVTDDRCVPIYAIAPNLELNIGTTARLYVLGEATRQVEASASWNDQVEIRDEWKGVPPNDLGNEPAGARFSLEFFADRMMSGDRTAADHLTHYLSRLKIEAIQSEMGHSNPNLNVPFLTSSENYKLKVSASEEAQSAFANGSIDDRKAQVGIEIAAIPVDRQAGQSWITPRRINEIGWFASTNDLCNAMRFLRDQSEKPELEPVATILQNDHAMWVDRQTFSLEWFVASGEEPGIMNMTWLLQRNDGRWFFISGTLNDTTQPILDVTTNFVLLQTPTLLPKND